MAEGRSKGAIRAALGHRDFRLLLGGQAISNTGDWLYNVSLIVYVLDVTHSGTWVAARFARTNPEHRLGGAWLA
jgi:hypothetical protein